MIIDTFNTITKSVKKHLGLELDFEDYKRIHNRDKYLLYLNNDLFQSDEFKIFKKKILPAYKFNYLVQLKYIEKKRMELLQKDYLDHIKSKFSEAMLIDSKSKYTIAAFIGGDEDLSLSLITKAQKNFSLQDRDFKDKDSIVIKIPKKFSNNHKSNVYYKNSYKNDLMLYMKEEELTSCNGLTSSFSSVDDMIYLLKKDNITISDDIWIGFEY